MSIKSHETHSVPFGEIDMGTTFLDGLIAYKAGDDLKFFTSRCSHLGCRINEVADGRLICPCHGSEYDASTGQVLKGPSVKPLQELDYQREDDLIFIESAGR